MGNKQINGVAIESIEQKWQKIWEEQSCFNFPENAKNPYYVLEMFPYPSGKIHMGHVRNYAIGDVIARYKKAKGYDVLHPIGWDAFGLPAENAAIKNKTHPSAWTYENIANMRDEIKSIGISYDWNTELATCDAEYYQHEQAMFLDFLEKGIAYRKQAKVNWDPVDQTVLANEQVIDGRGWRSGALVEQRTLDQWFLKITDYAEELLNELDNLTESGWPARVTAAQREWIGKSEGASIKWKVIDSDQSIEVFTTRPETIFGASFIGISAGHEIALELAENNAEIDAFVKKCEALGTAKEAIDTAEKEGIDTGLRVNHPFIEGKEIPVYIANFVLMGYGTGAVFACPAHDERDFEFATKYGLEITQVVEGGKPPYTGDGKLINSDFLNNLSVSEARTKAISELVSANIGEGKINYKLRDWGISRQRYWGCPIPIIHCDDCGTVPVPKSNLPVKLPEDVDFSQEINGNPLEHHPTWKQTTCPSCGKPATRETDTFDTFFESSWYFIAYATGLNSIGKDKINQLLPVNNYIGGIEHAVLHLLYARFFTKALRDTGYHNVNEPFKALLTQGMVCHESYKNEADEWLYPEEVTKTKDGAIDKNGNKVTIGRSEKMSKSKCNTVSPQEIITEFGADTARMFMLSDSPPDKNIEWTSEGARGIRKFLDRLITLASKVQDNEPAEANLKSIHKTIKEVADDFENNRFNKAIARIRELTSAIEKEPTKQGIEAIVQLLNPICPHVTEELWNQLGNGTIIANLDFPTFNEELAKDEGIIIGVQVNGKLRGDLAINDNMSDDDIKHAAQELERVKANTEGKQIRKVIYVPNRIVNIVAA